jgi:hypothetical protein
MLATTKKMANRFQKIRELGSEGKKSSPLLLQELQYENEWVHENLDDNNAAANENSLWDTVQRAIKDKKECFRRMHLDRSADNVSGTK